MIKPNIFLSLSYRQISREIKKYFLCSPRHRYDTRTLLSFNPYKKAAPNCSFFLLCSLFAEFLCKKSSILNYLQIDGFGVQYRSCRRHQIPQHHAQLTPLPAKYQAYDICMQESAPVVLFIFCLCWVFIRGGLFGKSPPHPSKTF